MATVRKRYGSNPYGTLGPSPSRVARITPSYNPSPPPPGARPAPPTAPALPSDAEVWARVNALYAPMQADVQRAWAQQQAASAARLASIGGLGGAWGGLLREIAPHNSMGWFANRDAIPGMAGAAAGAMQGRIAADVAGSEAIAQAQAPAAPGAAPVDAAAAGAVLTGLQGTIPAQMYGAMGEAADKESQANIQAADATTKYDITEEIIKASQVDAGYTQQLIDLAKKRPEMYFQVLDELRSVASEADKLKLQREQFAFDRTQANREWADTRHDNRLQDQAFNLQKKELGYSQANKAADRRYDWANLSFKTQKAANDARMAAEKAAAQGRQIDASASKVIGFIVDKSGRPILQGGKRIKVAPDPKAKVKTVTNRNRAASDARQGAFSFGKKLMADSAVVAGDRIGPDYKGKYIARKGVKGVFPDGSTNNIALAARSVTFAQAMQQAWAAVDGDGLVAQYGMSPAEVRKQLRQALIRAGWKPDGVRP